MLKEIRPERREFVESYCLYFALENCGGGYVFECDKDGKVLDLCESAKINYDKCMSGEIQTRPPVIQDDSYWVTHRRVCECDCGSELEMYTDYEGLVYCNCGRCYNAAGQSIRPRSEWEERYDDDY